MNKDLLIAFVQCVSTTAGVYYVVEHAYEGEMWIDSYLANDETEALKLAEFNHSDLLPGLIVTCLGVEH